MGVEYLQKLNIRSYDRDQISLVSSFQFCRAELSEYCKYLMPDHGQQLEGDKMVAVLLPVVEDPPCHSQYHQNHKKRGHLCACSLQQDMYKPGPGENGKKDGTQISHCSQENGKEHDREQRGHKAHKTAHDLYAASSFIVISHTAASFPYCSSSIWDRYSFS